MSYHGTGLRSSTSVKPAPKVKASKQVSHWAVFGSRARSYYSAGWDLPAKKPNLIRFEVRGDTVTRVEKPMRYMFPQPPVGAELREGISY